MVGQHELVDRVKSYDPKFDSSLLNLAYDFSEKAHGGQRRDSGDLYFSHPLEVADILTDYRLDGASIVTALLHDTIEDTDTSQAEIKKIFGDEISQLVDGVTKLTRIELQSNKAKQAENFRKFVLATSRDIRVLLVKLADRLHNMRTIQHVDMPERRRRIAQETMDIYAPLAARIGMNDFKDELEDLAFSELNRDARDSIVKRLKFLREEGENLIERVTKELNQVLLDDHVTAVVSGREKSPYSIWRKMSRKQVAFEQLSDIMAFRILVSDYSDCYRTLGIIHANYRAVPGRFRDYLSTPKPNGYQSLHTGILGPEKHRIEVQIRTSEMHEIAERGVAAHWRYSQLGAGPESVFGLSDDSHYRWLQELLDILDDAAGPEDFLEHTKLEMFSDQVFVFSPKGEVYALPQSSTPIDFAYAVHTEVGDHCVGSMINGRNMPLQTLLQNGDQVEILISENQTPSPNWEQFVVTGKARARIRRVLRQQKQLEYVELGKSIIEQAFLRRNEEFDEGKLIEALKELHANSVHELYTLVGQGVHTGRDVVGVIYPDKTEEKNKQTKNSLFSLRRSKRKTQNHGEFSVPIDGLIPGMAVHLAKCCYPLPGERIVAIATTGKGVTVHTIDCMTLEAFSDSPERWVDVSWTTDPESINKQLSRLNVTLVNEPGSLGELANIIAKSGGNISNLQFTNRNPDFFDMTVDIEVDDNKHLSNVLSALRAGRSVSTVGRSRS
ncbi:MAG: bifunctional (p)ppGpp synthetase/guanosine-3',5'-bis(diphosphate) 3'-pyrophosphohydrolase [Alphaproteobacteria bacterium]|nr:bifunctional (p)ppGpp synthetase/guanosine-3',5'-bis(diphosphate) 3'-pyrophosphohydrolase [Alphaproteobacteria bacterium]PPR13209.1 MAG: GTP pyrophosphokinase rsh [Alphaproteobacteria bacterium MarineAlpha12_Bin1]|tara:strand:+ start:435 stop:2612 length:2178 start_codon:yes stop_codon:yes gene_type:complete